MQTTTKLRTTGIDSTTSVPRRRKVGAALVAAGALLVGVLATSAELTSDPPRARSTSSPVVAATPDPTAPATAFENDFSLCALGVDGIEATYPGPLMAQTVARYSASCAPAEDGGPFPAPND